MHVQPHDPIDHLKQLRRLKSHRDIATALQAVILAMEGRTAPQIAAATGRSRRPVQEWVRRYNHKGLAGLSHRRRSGQPPKLPREREQDFKQRMLAGPTHADEGLCTLRGKDAQRILRQEFGASYSLGGAIDVLHRLNLACLKPRPRHRKNDPAAMRVWVDSAPLLSGRSSVSIPNARSRSGDRTKRASASRAR